MHWQDRETDTREVASKAGSGDDPMDIDSLINVKSKGNSEGKDKGYGNQSTNKGKGPSDPNFDGACHNGGKYGHNARVCWSGKPKSKAKARTRKN